MEQQNSSNTYIVTKIRFKSLKITYFFSSINLFCWRGANGWNTLLWSLVLWGLQKQEYLMCPIKPTATVDFGCLNLGMINITCNPLHCPLSYSRYAPFPVQRNLSIHHNIISHSHFAWYLGFGPGFGPKRKFLYFLTIFC